MINLMDTSNEVAKRISKDSPKLLVGIGIIGMIATSVLVAKAAPKAKKAVDDICKKEDLSKTEKAVEIVKTAGPLYLPAVTVGACSIGCIVASYNINASRLAALAAAYSFSEDRYISYKRKVLETLGNSKEAKLREEIVKEQIEKNPPPTGDTPASEDMVRYQDPYTKRYFWATPSKIEKIENSLNRRLMTEMWISLNEFYYEVGLDPCRMGDDLGWNTDVPIAFRPVPVWTEEYGYITGLEFDIQPRFDYKSMM